MSKIQQAADFAKAAHESIDQRRKFTNEPYIVHPAEVAEIVASVSDDENMICAAWLHDVVEDTPVTLDDIKARFGDDIAHLVDGLTNVSKLADGNRKARIAIDRDHTAGTDSRTKTIKLADLIANLDGIVDQNAGFARKYLPEKESLLKVLCDGNSKLIERVGEVIRVEREKLAKIEWQPCRAREFGFTRVFEMDGH